MQTAPSPDHPPFRLEPCRCPGCGSGAFAIATRSAAQLSSMAYEFRFVRCSDCGLVYINPRVAPEDIGIFYDDYLLHAGTGAWGRFESIVDAWQQRVDMQRVRVVRRHVRLGPSSAVLDVGCGKPTFLREVHRTTGARGVGIDFTDAGWRDRAWPELRLHTGTVASVNPQPPFEAITMWHALEHDPHPRETLEQLLSWTRPGAPLIVEVPDYDSKGRRLQGSAWGGFHTPRHYVMFTAASLRTLLETSGWAVERVQRKGTLDPFVLWWLGAQPTRESTPERRFLRFTALRTASWPLWGRPGAQGWGLMLAVARNPSFSSSRP
ncbi:MAG: class I SAM-dependent methyltransferase [Myxococcota bacterium]